MKPKLSLTVIVSFFFCFLSPFIHSQVAPGFNYQALARDASQNPIINTALTVRISIQTTLNGGTILWQETHAITTDEFGVMSFIIGQGSRSGGTADQFSDIDWGAGPRFIKTEIDKGSGFLSLGSSQFWSVPYSMVAGNLAGNVTKISVLGKTDDLTEPLFEVKNKDGQTVFAVYNEGVRVYVDDGESAKGGDRGGFAIGGFGGAKGAGNLFIVSPDSIRAYIGTNAKGGDRGGFAIGGMDGAKGIGEEYLRVTRDSTRINVNTDAKGSRGGFAIGGLEEAKGSADFFNLSRENYFIGENSGANNAGGMYNSFLGYEAGKSNTEGNSNIFIGYNSGYSNTEGYENIFIGNISGYKNTGDLETTNGSYNIFMGSGAGYNNIGGLRNIFLGYQSGLLNTSGESNVFVGMQSGLKNKTGGGNVFLGPYTGFENDNGFNNVFVGNSSGEQNISGNNNIFIGPQSGQKNKTGNDNTYLGHVAGLSNTGGSSNTVLGSNAATNRTSGDNNVIIGSQSGQYGLTGSDNVFIGTSAGQNCTASGNIFIGNQAGSSLTDISNTLIIDNSINAVPLIKGDFSLSQLQIMANTGINTAPDDKVGLKLVKDANDIWPLYVTGQGFFSEGTVAGSDINFKKNILPLDNALNMILSLQGVSFEWRTDEFPDMGFSGTRQIGLVAQEVEKVLPELVKTGTDGYKSVNYEKLTPVLIEAVKSQQKIIESQNIKLIDQDERLKSQQQRIDDLESSVKRLLNN